MHQDKSQQLVISLVRKVDYPLASTQKEGHWRAECLWKTAWVDLLRGRSAFGAPITQLDRSWMMMLGLRIWEFWWPKEQPVRSMLIFQELCSGGRSAPPSESSQVHRETDTYPDSTGAPRRARTSLQQQRKLPGGQTTWKIMRQSEKEYEKTSW